MSTLMYVKEDLIIPHHFSFYDLISTKARGKSGPLFHFDVHEDIRTQHDARLEKDESHAGMWLTRLAPFTAAVHRRTATVASHIERNVQKGGVLGTSSRRIGLMQAPTFESLCATSACLSGHTGH